MDKMKTVGLTAVVRKQESGFCRARRLVGAARIPEMVLVKLELSFRIPHLHRKLGRGK